MQLNGYGITDSVRVTALIDRVLLHTLSRKVKIIECFLSLADPSLEIVVAVLELYGFKRERPRNKMILELNTSQ